MCPGYAPQRISRCRGLQSVFIYNATRLNFVRAPFSRCTSRETHRVWYSFLLTLRDTAIFSRQVSNGTGGNMPAHITSSESGIASAHLRRCPTGGLGGTVNPGSASCHPTGTTTASAWAAYGTPSYAAVTAASTFGAKAAGVASGAFSYACPRVSTGTRTHIMLRAQICFYGVEWFSCCKSDVNNQTLFVLNLGTSTPE